MDEKDIRLSWLIKQYFRKYIKYEFSISKNEYRISIKTLILSLTKKFNNIINIKQNIICYN